MEPVATHLDSSEVQLKESEVQSWALERMKINSKIASG